MHGSGRFAAVLVLFFWGCACAHAQLLGDALDTVRGLTETSRETLEETRRTARSTLTETRTRTARLLYRRNRDVIDLDPDGEPVVRGQAVATGITAEALARARADGFEVLRTVPLAGLELEIAILRAPGRMSARRALRRLRRLDPAGTYDYNHIYLQTGQAASGAHAAAEAEEGADRGAAAGRPLRIGMVDGGVDAAHPALSNFRITARAFIGEGPVPSDHGTAAASLIAMSTGSGGYLYAADVYGGSPLGGNVEALARAFAWLGNSGVTVINVSLVGPANAILEALVRRLAAKGVTVVAAVGNDGPSAPPLYPAAYDGVVAVTAVDRRRRVLLEACRGAHVDFAAPGAGFAAAAKGGTFREVRGTSFAAPIVAGMIAVLRSGPAPDARLAEQKLRALSIDLGRKGRDPVYGDGLVGERLRLVSSR